MSDMMYVGRKTPKLREAAGITQFAWDDRGELRTANPAAGDYAIVEGLGMFRYYPGSTEPDDDESCFATAGGRWLIELVTWDFIQAWDLPWRDYIESNLVTTYAYEDRDTLRSRGTAGETVLVSGLGLFIFVQGSTAIDDDETALVTTTGGAWEIQAVGWDMAYALINTYAKSYTDDLHAKLGNLQVTGIVDSYALNTGTIAANTTVLYSISASGVASGDYVAASISGSVWPARAASANGYIYVYVTNPNDTISGSATFTVSAVAFRQV
jgi:hypothetical protein